MIKDLGALIYNQKILLNNENISWADIYYAVESGLFSADIIKKYAFQMIDGDSSDDDCEIFFSENPIDSLRLLEQKIHTLKSEAKRRRSIRVVRFLVLKNILEAKRESWLEEIAAVYEDTGCPEDMDGFIYYMPANEERDPEKHTRKQNEERMFRLAVRFLDTEKKILNL